MKAKEYLAKYEDRLYADDEERLKETVRNLLDDFTYEMVEITQQRHVKMRTGLDSVVRELNDKWNALVRMLESKHDGHCRLLRNGFQHACGEAIRKMDAREAKSDEANVWKKIRVWCLIGRIS